MKTRTWMACLACIVIGFALSGLAQPTSNGQDKADNLGRIKWEYNIVYNPDVKRLDELGGEGWELVAATADTPRAVQACYLKRPVIR